MGEMSQILKIAGLSVAGLSAAYGLRRLEKLGRDTIIGKRLVLTDEEIFNQFYASRSVEKDAIIKAWQRVGERLHVEYGKLRPSDKIEALRGLPKWLGSDGFTGVDDIEAEITSLAKTGVSVDVPIETVDDVAVLLLKKDSARFFL